MTETMQINRHKDFLFYQNSMRTTFYVFNAKIGISITQYNEAGKTISSKKSTQYKSDNDFINVYYLYYYEKFILLAQNNNFIKGRQIKEIFVHCPFNKQNNNRKINKILSAGNGNYYCLIDQQIIHFIKQNNQDVKDIQLRELINDGRNQKLDISNILLFSDESDWYLFTFKINSKLKFKQKIQASYRRLCQKVKHQSKRKSIPFLDLIKGASIKYGPCNNVLKTTPTKTQLYVQECNHEKIQSYFDLLDLDYNEELIKFDSYQSIQGFKDLIYQLLSRQTLHHLKSNNKTTLQRNLQEEYQKNQLNYNIGQKSQQFIIRSIGEFIIQNRRQYYIHSIYHIQKLLIKWNIWQEHK